MDQAIDGLIAYKKSSRENFDFIGNSTRHLELIKKYFRGTLGPTEMPCYAGYNRLQIIQEGKLYFCVSQAENQAAFGDIRKNTLKELWFSRRAGVYRKQIRRCRVPCLQWCSYRDGFMELSGMLQKERLFKKIH